MSGHVHLWIVEFKPNNLMKMKDERLRLASHSFCLPIISEHECNIMFTI